MKILYVHNFISPDYQADCVYHGLIDSGFEVYETAYPGYMMADQYDMNSIYFKGFTIFGKLTHTPRVESPEMITEKIKSKFYDVIIYGCVYRNIHFEHRQCLDYLDVVKDYYPKDKVHMVDGSDQDWNFAIDDGLDQYGTIWKRELMDFSFGNPISFAIPESQLIDYDPIKEKVFSYIVPYDLKTYVFTSEKMYYNDYAISYYGRTRKKAGWDCMRHYEILANMCVPYFFQLEECPKTIMTNFPKDVILETNKYAEKGKIHPQYDQINRYLFDYTKKHLTTKQLVKRFL